MPESRFLDLSISLNAIDAANGEDAGAPGDDDDMTLETELLVEPVEDNPSWFKVAEPLTFFGAAPILNMGDIIQVEDSEFDGLLMTKVISRGRTWSHEAGILFGNIHNLDEPALKPLLDRFIDLGGMWEYNSKRLRLQYPLTESQEDPPIQVCELADQITSTLRECRATQEQSTDANNPNRRTRHPG